MKFTLVKYIYTKKESHSGILWFFKKNRKKNIFFTIVR